MSPERSLHNNTIPLDKSWLIRMGVLDLLYGNPENSLVFLKNQHNVSDDITALGLAMTSWKHNEPVRVGESGTLYRFLRFASWKLKLEKEFVVHGTLSSRKICSDPTIINYPIEKLLTLDNGTSQWASATVLLGNSQTVNNAPLKLQLTFEAVKHWRLKNAQGQSWIPRYDQTIAKQAATYLAILRGESPIFAPLHSEDYCFARTFGYISAEEGESRWPSLRGHESDRIYELEEALSQQRAESPITSADHRIVQAVAMLAKARSRSCEFQNPGSVSKSWPEFWNFLNTSSGATT